MNNILWSADDEDELEDTSTYDLCGTFAGKYVDICSNGENVWKVLFNCVRLKENIASRNEAKEWAENADLIEELSNARHY